jgi:hypothetical protein
LADLDWVGRGKEISTLIIAVYSVWVVKFENFQLEKFAPFVNNNNINAIFTELSDYVSH